MFDRLGSSVAIAGDTVVVGAPGDTGHTVSAGSAYVFHVVSDQEGPITSNVVATPNPASVTQPLVVSATIDDRTTGGSTIVSARYEIRDSTGTVVISGEGDASACALPLTGSICPTTSGFDQVQVAVAVGLSAGRLAPGVYDQCVRGTRCQVQPRRVRLQLSRRV